MQSKTHAHCDGSSKEEQKRGFIRWLSRGTRKAFFSQDQDPLSQQPGGRRGGDILNQTVNKSCHGDLMEERTEVNLPKAPKGPIKIAIDREQKQ